MEKAAKEAEKLRKIQEEADRKAERKAAREAEKEAKKEAARQKSERKKAASRRKTHPASAVQKSSTGNTAAHKGRDAAKEKKAKEKQISAQQSIPYREMAKDGICRVQDKYYSKTIRFYDINYQLAQNEDKNAIFENWCDFLNRSWNGLKQIF